MNLELFRARLNKSRFHPNDIQWIPGWFGPFAKNRPVIDGLVWFGTVGVVGVLKFLPKLRKRGAW